MKLQTKAILLRPVNLKDVTDKYVQWLNDIVVNQYMETRFREQTFETIKDYVESVNLDPNQFLFAIIDLSSNRHIGNIKLSVNPYHKRGELSLFIGDKNNWGCGKATEAIRLVSEYGSKQLALTKLTAGCYSVNLASARAFEKAGFHCEAVLKDEYICGNKRVDRLVFAWFPDKVIE